jgi:hypothetical protein
MSGPSLREGLDRFGNVRLRMRLLTRAAARAAWVKSGGKGEDAVIDFQNDPRLYGLDPALIALLVQVALLLFKYWMENRIDEPSVVPSADEPVDYETEDCDGDD